MYGPPENLRIQMLIKGRIGRNNNCKFSFKRLEAVLIINYKQQLSVAAPGFDIGAWILSRGGGG